MPRYDSGLFARRDGSPFSLFERLLVLLLLVIFIWVALNRYQQYASSVQRASFQLLLGQLRSSLSAVVLEAVLDNRQASLLALAGSNPMRLLAETPGNYLGEWDGAPVSVPAHHWYFDRSQGELVYQADARTALYILHDGQWQRSRSLRFSIQCRAPQGGACEVTGASPGVVQLVSARDYRWLGPSESAPSESPAQR